MLFHVVGKLGEFFGGHAQGSSGMGADGGDDLVVEIFDELGNLFFQTFGGGADGLADARRGVFDLAVEVGHDVPRDVVA